MAGPRFDGVTAWITAYNNMLDTEGGIASTIAAATQAISMANETMEATKYTTILNPEVNHRPAGQQWPVCTP